MAQKTANWTASEAYKIIRAGINKPAMQEIAEQAPVFAMYAAKGADEIISALPDFITVQKIERAIKGENIPDVKPEPEKAEEPVPTTEAVTTEKNEPEKPVEEKPKGKRGRPAKAKDEKPEPTETEEEQPKKKRGRPAKVKAPEPVEEVDEEQDEDEQEEEAELEEPETEEPAEDEDDNDWEI